MMEQISYNVLSDILGVSRATISNWERSGKLIARKQIDGKKYFFANDLMQFPQIRKMMSSDWELENVTTPNKIYHSIELFAGAGGLALGFEQAGFHHVLLNEIDSNAADTLRKNRPNWNVICDDIINISFREFHGKVDLISGGFPCQAFSYAGKKGGFEDARGTLFFELARAVDEVQPKIMFGENVKGLSTHDGGKTIHTIKAIIDELGYYLIEPRVLKALFYRVPQKRERLILVAIRKDLVEKGARFEWPSPFPRIMTLRDAFYAGELYDTDVPESEGQLYPAAKKKVLELVPMGGDWRDLPLNVQKEYLGKSFYSGGGKTGIARRLDLDEPSLTLTCSPAQKQTERCHPLYTRPLTVREYARIQTFPDEWQFSGSITSQYQQIGNAVPVNLALAIGRSLIRTLNSI